MQFLATGHRGRGAGLATDQLPTLQRAILLAQFKGRTIYVDSAAPATSGGDSWSSAYLTLATALANAQANDLILIAPGHAETIAATVTSAKAGVTIIGLGRGTQRPTFTMSAVGSSIIFNAASVTLANCLFLSTAACTIVLDINAVDVTIQDCGFRRSSGTAPVVWIDINGGGANAADRAQILGCRLNSGTTTGADEFIELGEVADGVTIEDCVVWGDFANACIHNPTGKVLTNLLIQRCILSNLQTGDHSIELVSACTGMLAYNLYGNDMTQATGVDPGSCRSYQCFHDDTIDVSGILAPAAT